MGQLDLLSLRLFLTVCEEGNLGRAAKREHIAASAVTKRIKELEDLFGVRLLHRTPRGVVATAEGDALAARALDVFAAVDRLRGDLGEFAEGLRGSVRISANTSALVEFLASDLRRFAGIFPHIELELQEQLSRVTEHALTIGAADVGVLAATRPLDTALETRSYRRDRLAVVLPAGHELAGEPWLAFEQLLALDVIGVQQSSAVTMLIAERAAAIGRAVRFRFRVSTNEAATSLVAAGFGVAVQPLGMKCGGSATADVRAVPLREAWAERELFVCYRRAVPLQRAARALVEFLCDTAAQ